MEKQELKSILEGLLFVSPEPLTVSELKKLVRKKTDNEAKAETVENVPVETEAPVPSEDAGVLAQLEAKNEELEGEISKVEIKEALDELIEEYAQNTARGFELIQIAKGYQFRTKESVGPYLRNMQKIPKTRLSTPAMETLAIVAYQQPLHRAKIEQIRGVDSGGVLKTLLDRDLLRIVGRSEEPGRPILYGTTQAFLETFALSSLSELPTLKDLESLEVSETVSSGETEDASDEAEESFLDTTGESTLSALDEESGVLLDELENSMKGLKNLEEQIFTPEKENPSEDTSSTSN